MKPASVDMADELGINLWWLGFSGEPIEAGLFRRSTASNLNRSQIRIIFEQRRALELRPHSLAAESTGMGNSGTWANRLELDRITGETHRGQRRNQRLFLDLRF